ncbi:hypothetical protein BJ508DRAFT_98455 [Ascobolus immersus RN42]|uniref:Uncharacterized protein n=1 Tax=Ascobolus immersus RN42 TaxID=1160509 RepID=A0A3N4IN43_ASCIM|nr:hypothetical protein BJ508DRAFT_98455 [Ascobolus immersus RN42]
MARGVGNHREGRCRTTAARLAVPTFHTAPQISTATSTSIPARTPSHNMEPVKTLLPNQLLQHRNPASELQLSNLQQPLLVKGPWLNHLRFPPSPVQLLLNNTSIPLPHHPTTDRTPINPAILVPLIAILPIRPSRTVRTSTRMVALQSLIRHSTTCVKTLSPASIPIALVPSVMGTAMGTSTSKIVLVVRLQAWRGRLPRHHLLAGARRVWGRRHRRLRQQRDQGWSLGNRYPRLGWILVHIDLDFARLHGFSVKGFSRRFMVTSFFSFPLLLFGIVFAFHFSFLRLPTLKIGLLLQLSWFLFCYPFPFFHSFLFWLCTA